MYDKIHYKKKKKTHTQNMTPLKLLKEYQEASLYRPEV